MLEKRAESHLSAAPWNDGGASFSTRERLVVYTKNVQKGVVFKKKAHFPHFPGDVLRTLCWAAYDCGDKPLQPLLNLLRATFMR
jgi:hypothetical protein